MDKLIFEPIDERSTEQKYKDIEARNANMQKELANILEKWQEFKQELSVIQNKRKSKVVKQYDSLFYCFVGVISCLLLLSIINLIGKI